MITPDESEQLHARAVALVLKQAPHIGAAEKHDLAGRACLAVITTGADLADAVREELAKLPQPAPQVAPGLTGVGAYVAEKCRDWERKVGTQPTPEQRLQWAREAEQYRPHTHDAPTMAQRNAQANAAMDRYERATGLSRHTLLPSQILAITDHYARAGATVPTPVRDMLKAEGREASPTIEERVALHREKQAASVR
jgi:hypothetical protein